MLTKFKTLRDKQKIFTEMGLSLENIEQWGEEFVCLGATLKQARQGFSLTVLNQLAEEATDFLIANPTWAMVDYAEDSMSQKAKIIVLGKRNLQ
jgi:hypothetical protein